MQLRRRSLFNGGSNKYGVRITPVNSQPVNSSDTFFMHATSAETNVAAYHRIWAWVKV